MKIKKNEASTFFVSNNSNNNKNNLSPNKKHAREITPKKIHH